MRLLKLGVYYPAYLEQFYAARPRLASRPYAEQHAALIHDSFGSSDFWTRALAALGYETRDLVANAEPLQRAWAAERGRAFDERDWVFDITAAQVEEFRPEVLLVADYTTITAAFLRRLKDGCPSLRLVLVWCGAPYADGSIFRECDVVLSCVPELVAHFAAQGHRSRHVHHAFDRRVLDRLGARAAPAFDFVFAGSIVKAQSFHTEREALLLKLVQETDLEIWSNVGAANTVAAPARPSADEGWGRGASRLASLPLVGGVAGRAARRLRGVGVARATGSMAVPSGVDERILRRARAPLFGLEMFRQLRAARVALNTHIDISATSASNMRLFEATGVGACLLTDWKPNLPELFEPDAEVVAYRGADECVEKVRYLLAHEGERRRVADAGQRRTLAEHTFADRAARIDAAVREALSNV